MAFTLRVVASFLVYELFDGSPVLDDQTYSALAADAASGNTQQWTPYVAQLYGRTASLTYPLTAIYWVVGPHRIAGALFVAMVGAAVAVIVMRLASHAFSERVGILSGVFVAILPSQVLWSSLVLKDPLVWLAWALLALVVARGAQGAIPLRSFAITLVGLLLVMTYLRLHSLIVACWALALVGWTGTSKQRLGRAAVSISAALFVPWGVGLGPGGINYVIDSAKTVSQLRILNAVGAESAFVGTETNSTPDPPQEETPHSGGADASAPQESQTLDGEGAADINILHLPTGLRVMLFEPLPWRAPTSFSFRLAQAETLLWYPLLALAAFGLLRVRQVRNLTIFPVVAGGGVLVMYALSEGNIGTAYRHRGEFVWIVCLLAAAGVAAVLDRHRDDASL